MNSDDLTTAQANKLRDQIWPMNGYLHRLVKRLDERQVLMADPLYQKAIAARNAVEALAMHVHYMGCSGVGPPRMAK